MSNVMSALGGCCRAIKFDSCKNLLSSTHTTSVTMLCSVSLKIKRKCYVILRNTMDVRTCYKEGREPKKKDSNKPKNLTSQMNLSTYSFRTSLGIFGYQVGICAIS